VLSTSERELIQLQSDLDYLSAQLVEKEMALAALQQAVRQFEAEYHRRIGPYYLRLDELAAELCERRAAREPFDATLREAADSARAQAESTRAGVEAAEREAPPPRVALTEDVKKLFRKAAMRLHPDRATDEADRVRRERWMAELNAAYTRGDGDGIEAVLREFEQSPEAVAGDDAPARMERTRRQIATVRRHLARIEAELAEFEADATNRLRLEFERQTAEGSDPYAVLIADIEARIAETESALAALVHSEPLAEPPFRPEGLKHRTERGEKVRSKSEVIIANALHQLGVCYFYERPLTGRDGDTLRPDFTVFDGENRPILWEHLGMLHREDYRDRWDEKQAWYEAEGFTVGVDLFISRDEADGSLDSRKIGKMARFIAELAGE
jgi:hypothetical protein